LKPSQPATKRKLTMQDTSSAPQYFENNRLLWISVISICIGGASCLAIELYAPLSPWLAILNASLYLLPLLAVYLYILHYAARNCVTTIPTKDQRSAYYLILGCGYLTWAACVTVYNRFADYSLKTEVTEKIISIDYNNSKYGRLYYVTINSPKSLQLPLLDTSTTNIKLRQGEHEHIILKYSEIRFPVYHGALGLPWTPKYSHQLIGLSNRINIKLH
jgi:hypothetical protein